jgi:LytS/YehU family sensor histidine kinase
MKNNILYHVAWWCFFWIVPPLLGQYVGLPENLDVLFPSLMQNLGTMVVCSTLISYTNYFSLYYFFEKKRYLLHFLCVALVFSLGTMICQYVLIPFPHELELARFRYIPGVFASVILSTLFWFAQKGYIKELEFKEAKTKRVEAEMGLLKMQIQPHFLFNTLNNVYATNLKSPTKANEMILQLADLLRYQLEITKQEKINLREEIKLTENYIALEKVRLHNCEVLIETKGDFASYTITPLLFLPLVENAFKYSSDIQKSRIRISFELKDNRLEFLCHNTIGRNTQISSNKMGLENVRKRLELLYPNTHSISLKQLDDDFYLTLTICL